MAERSQTTSFRSIAHKMARWADRIGDLSHSAGYCMTGSWRDFYPSLLFPGKALNAIALNSLLMALASKGYDASLNVTPYEDASGVFLYMKLRKLS